MVVDRIRKAQGERLKAVRIAAGYRSARDAALSNEWPESTYRAHEGGTRTIGQDDAERYATRFRFDGVDISAQGILFGNDDASTSTDDDSEAVRVMGVISAGGLIDTNEEQLVAGQELIRVTIPFRVPEGTIAFRVAGLSMHPRYDPDDVVLCSEHGDAPERLVGLYAAVRTTDGSRYLKRVLRGSRRGLFHLESHNATLMPDVRLTWAAGIIITVHDQHWRSVTTHAARALV